MFLNLFIFLQSLELAAVKGSVAWDFQKFYSSAPWTVAKVDHFAPNRNKFFYIEAKRTSLLKKTFLSNRSEAVYKVNIFFKEKRSCLTLWPAAEKHRRRPWLRAWKTASNDDCKGQPCPMPHKHPSLWVWSLCEWVGRGTLYPFLLHRDGDQAVTYGGAHGDPSPPYTGRPGGGGTVDAERTRAAPRYLWS